MSVANNSHQNKQILSSQASLLIILNKSTLQQQYHHLPLKKYLQYYYYTSQHQSIPPVIMNIFGHVYKYEAVLWSLEKLRKTIFCYKMIHFSLRKLRFSGNMYFSYLERLALAKVEKVL